MKAEDTHSAFDVLFASPEIVFQENVEDATEAEGGLDDVRGEFTNCGGKTTQ